MSDFEAGATFLLWFVAFCLLIIGFTYLMERSENRSKSKPKNTFKK